LHIILLEIYPKEEDNMTEQLHKRFSTEEVKMLLREYLKDKKKLPYFLQILQISKRRFFQLVQEYRENPEGFSIIHHHFKMICQLSLFQNLELW